MSKELIARLREYAGFDPDRALMHSQAADLIEAQQNWIASLEQNARDADRMYKELETELAAAQAQRDKLLAALQQMCKAVIADHEAWATSYECQIAQEAIANVKDDV